MKYFRVEVRRLTQREVADLAHVGLNTISRLEHRGVRDPAVYVKVRRALGVSEADVQAYLTARPADARLQPLIRWFTGLSDAEQRLVGQCLRLLWPDQASRKD